MKEWRGAARVEEGNEKFLCVKCSQPQSAKIVKYIKRRTVLKLIQGQSMTACWATQSHECITHGSGAINS